MITVLKQLIRQIVPYLLFWIDPALIRAVCRVVIFILITITLVTPSITLAVFNQQINYQGKLTDSSNVAVSDGNYSIVFSLYTVSSGGSNVWTETKTVTVTNGLFSTMLGSDTALSSVDFNQTLYLGVKVGSDSEMTPRKTIGTVPAAFEADKLDGLDSLSFINSATTTLPNVWSMSGLGQVGSSSATTTALGNLAVIGTTIFNGLVSGYQQISAPFFTATSTTQASTFPLFTGTTATITNATTTTLFSTTASSTNLFTSNFTLGRVSGFLKATAGAVATSLIDLTADITGTLGIANGGTNATSFGTNLLTYFDGTRLTSTSSPTVGYVVATTTTATSTFYGNVHIIGNLQTSASSTAAGQASFTYVPVLAHSFGAWVTGATGANAHDSTIYINPATAASDTNLLGAAVGGAVKFLIDAEGDVFANSLTLAGSQTVSTSSISTLIVENNSFLGDAANSDWTHIKGSAWVESNKSSGASSTALTITQTGTGNILRLASDYSTANPFFLVTAAGNVGVGTSSPYAPLAVVGQAVAAYFTATTSVASTFPYASTTGLTVSSLASTTNLLISKIGTSTQAFAVGSGLISNLDMLGGDLYIGGDAEVDGVLYVQGQLISSGSSEFTGAITFTRVPTLPHTFTSWAIGTANSNVSDATVYINPATADADTNLFGLAVGGSVKTMIDAEGDIFANSLTLSGGQTVSTSTISTLIVENNSFLGDAASNDWTHIRGSAWVESNKSSGASTTALTITQTGTGDFFRIASDYNDSVPYFVVKNSGNVGIGTTSPYTKLSVDGKGVFNQDVRADYFTATSTTQASTFPLFTGTTATITNATTTTLFSTTASSTNLFTSNFTLGRVSGFLKATAGAVATSLIDLTADITGTLGIANGGTNATSFGTNLLTYFDGTRLTSTSSPTVGYVVATSSRASILPYASTTALTISGTGYFAGSGIWNSAGSVGVGTTSPSVKLEVVTGTSGTENRFLVDPATTNGSNRTLRFSRLGDGWGIQSEYTNTGAVRDLSLQASGGNVGIGTSTPGVALDIVGSFGTKPTAISGTLLALSNTLSTANNTYASLISGNAAEAGIYLGDQNDVDIGGIIYNHTNNYLGFRTNNTADRLIIDSSGKVGINKSAPATTLDVVGTASSTGLQVNGTGNIQGSGDANRLTIDSASGSSVLNIINSGHGEHSAIQFTRERSTGPGIASGFIRSPSNTANNFGKLELGAFTSGTYATASSSVGSLFRLNSDASALSGGAYAELFRASTADLTENWLSFNMLNSATTETTYSQLRTILTASTTGDGSLAFLTRKANTLTEAMRIDHNSRLGVGTSTPNWLLQVAGTRPSFALSDTAGGTNLKHWLLSSQGGNLYIATSSDALATSTTAALTVSANGYLGIGSTTPAYALSVTGGLFATASSTMMNGINLTGGCFAISGTCLVGGGSGTVNSGTINGLAYYTGSTAVSSAGTNLFWDNTNTRLMLGHINRGINNLTASTTYIGQGYDGTGAGDAGGNTYISNGGDATGAGNSDGGAGGIITMVAGGLKTGSGSDGNDGIVNIGNSAGSRNAILSVYGTATTTDDLWVLGGDINLALTTASALTTNLSNGKDVAGAAGLAGTVNLAIGGEGTGASGDGGAGGTVNIANGGIGDGDDGGNAGTVYLAVGGEGDTDAGNVGGDGGTVLMVTGGTGNTNGTAGKVGIATSTPWRTLSVTGSVGFDGLTTNTGAAAASLCLSSANEVTKNTDNETCLASSLRYKNNVTDLATDTDLLDQLRTVSFNYKNESDPLTHYGLIAEEVAAIDTRLVSYDDEGLANGIRWSHLTTLLIKRTQEQEQRLDELSSLISGGDMLARLWTLDETTGNIKAFAVLDLNNFELRNVKAITSASGKWSIDDNGKLITEDIETKRLLVEEGVTTRDKASGDYYCIYVENGVVKTAAGRCEDLEEEDNGNNDDSEPEPEEPEEEPELPPTLEPDAPVDTPPTEEVPNPEPEPEPEPEPDQEPQSTPLVEDSPPDPIPANNEDSPQNPIPEESPQSPEPEPTS